MATKKSERAISFEHAGDMLTFKSANGDSFTVQLANLSPESREQAVLFGVARKCTNATALDAGSSVGEKWAALVEVAERLHSGGAWNGAAKEGGAGNEGGLVVLAISRVYSESVEKAQQTIVRTMEKKGLDRKAALKLWAGTDKVAAEIVAIKAERAAKVAATANVDSDNLMAEMED